VPHTMRGPQIRIFQVLCFVLLGECDPVSLLREADLSPFNVTQQILLDDFSR